jgi:rhodanese-related sulfurtransferase
MMPFPLNVVDLLGKFGSYIVFLIIGFSFGYVLEIAGFGNSRKLAAQFYLKEHTVLKVMFTGIIVAMTGIFLAAAMGILDYNLLWVNPTYVWPGIIGGLIMGVGFIIGGFCPGTSLVAVGTGKIDGMIFTSGVIFGIFVFGETVENFDVFFNSSYLGRYTLMDWLNMDTGWVVLSVIILALVFFFGAEKMEQHLGGVDPKTLPKLRFYGAGALIVLAIVIIALGQPTHSDKWTMLSPEKEPLLMEERAYQIHPGELLGLMNDDNIQLFLFDIRSESDYNLFHIGESKNVTFDDLLGNVPNMLLEPSNAVFVLISNMENPSTDAWKMMVAENVHNVYLLEGGVNNWLDVFSESSQQTLSLDLDAVNDPFLHKFDRAWGGKHLFSNPEPHDFELEFLPKVKLELKKGPSGGGCG